MPVVAEFLAKFSEGFLNPTRGIARWDVGFGLRVEPILEGAMRPTADRPGAVSLDDFFAAGAASPDETIQLAGLEEMLGNVPISPLGKEPGGNGPVPPAVPELAVDLQADGFGKRAKAVFPPWLPRCHGQRIARRNF
jgi:hypothetical protein